VIDREHKRTSRGIDVRDLTQVEPTDEVLHVGDRGEDDPIEVAVDHSLHVFRGGRFFDHLRHQLVSPSLQPLPISERDGDHVFGPRFANVDVEAKRLSGCVRDRDGGAEQIDDGLHVS
jgi:hypothetical protein